MPGVRALGVGICGAGTVGSQVFRLLRERQQELAARSGCQLLLRRVGARSAPSWPLGDVPCSKDVFAVADDPAVDVVVELIGGTDVARRLVLHAIAQGKHVVTANKALLAEHGGELFAAARRQGVRLAFEAAVGGGIPIIKVLQESLAVNRVEYLAGIINGTSNFILSSMEEGAGDFAEVLKSAQEQGFAEADPQLDLSGMDAAHKLSILGTLAFGVSFPIAQLYVEGIEAVTPMDLAYARELGYVIKPLAIARRWESGVELRVHPCLVPHSHLLAHVNGVMNAVFLRGDVVGSLLQYGAGAGGAPTASAVIADLLDVACVGAAAWYPPLPGEAPPRVLSIEEVRSVYYLRLAVQDRPGVLSTIARLFSEADISMEVVIQKGKDSTAPLVPLVLLTDYVAESALRQVKARLEALDSVSGTVCVLHVETPPN